MEILLVILSILIVGLAIYLVWLKGKISTQAQEQAQEQIKAWRDKELESIRKELAAIAQREAMTNLQRWKADNEQFIRQEAIKKSHHVITGKVTEQLVPYLPNFRYNPKNARFIGSPIDFIVFDGMDEGEVKQVVFIEVKTGSSSMTKLQKQVRSAIDTRKVKWEELRVDYEQISSIKLNEMANSYREANAHVSLRPYSMNESYDVGERISHNRFGAGRVIAVNNHKIEVQFAQGIKILVHAPK